MADANLVPDLVLFWLLLTRSTMGLREEKDDWQDEAGAVQRGLPEEEGRDQRQEIVDLQLKLDLDEEVLDDEEDKDENQLLIRPSRRGGLYRSARHSVCLSVVCCLLSS